MYSASWGTIWRSQISEQKSSSLSEFMIGFVAAPRRLLASRLGPLAHQVRDFREGEGSGVYTPAPHRAPAGCKPFPTFRTAVVARAGAAFRDRAQPARSVVWNSPGAELHRSEPRPPTGETT